MVDELDLVSRLKDVPPLPPEAYEEARLTLQAALAVSPEAEPAQPPARRRSRRRAWVIGGSAGLGIAAAAAAVAVAVAATSSVPASRTGSHGPVAGGHPAASGRGNGHPAGAQAANAPLMRLAADLQAHTAPLPGNATLVFRTQTNAAGQSTGGGVDLYTDSGIYYYALTESGLPAVIAAHEDFGGAGFAREVAAARYAVTGDLTTARQLMAVAPLDPGTKQVPWGQWVANLKGAERRLHRKLHIPTQPPTAAQQAGIFDNRIWEDSLDALQAGAGQPEVRAGVLRLLSTLPEVKVTSRSVDGRALLTLTAGAPATPPGYQEELTIDATTGVPIAFAGGEVGQRPETTSTYRVSRVTVADIAAGRF
jgi:hypothetical protein